MYRRTMSDGRVVEYDDEGINCDDIPEITEAQLAKGIRNPYAGFMKKGYTITINYDGYREIRKFDFSKVPKPASGRHIPYEVVIEKRE